MKNTIATIALLSVFATTPVFALAGYPDGYLPADKCNVPPDVGNYSIDNSTGKKTLTGCITAEAWSKAITNQNNQSKLHLPIVASGAQVVDEAGSVNYCLQGFNGAWYLGCYDLTHTDQYRMQQRQNAQATRGMGMYGYWLNH